MNIYFLEDLTNDKYVVYVVEQGGEGRLLKAFPAAQRITRAKAVQLCRTQGRAGDWCWDAQSEMQAARELGGDLDIEEARKATARAIECQLDFMAQMEQLKPMLEHRMRTGKPKAVAQAPSPKQG